MVRAIVRVDSRLFGAVARTGTPWLDRVLRDLSVAANNSVLWIAIATVLNLRGGLRGRRAALRGVGSIALTSALVNNGVKRLVARPRPSLRHVPAIRRLSAQPATTSFPSGHAASAFAFAVGASSELPAARIPLLALASTVAYSRVYVGVHYPLDVVVGAAAGAGLAYGSRLAFPVR
jgi:undecaprenyl-diphosphatase